MTTTQTKKKKKLPLKSLERQKYSQNLKNEQKYLGTSKK